MRLVADEEGAITLQWQWLPYCLATNMPACRAVSDELQDIVLLNAMTTAEDDLDALSAKAAEVLCATFGDVPGAAAAIRALAAS